jgi:hypothetical protein
MNEKQWLDCDDPKPMLEFLCDKRGESRKTKGKRQLRLFACACLRGIWALLRQEGSRQALECSERFADGLATDKELADAATKAQVALSMEHQQSRGSLGWQWQAAEAANHVARKKFDGGNNPSVRHVATSAATAWALYAPSSLSFEIRQNFHAIYLRDIFANPFRPITLDPRWRTSAIVNLAQAIYDDRSFDKLPVLANALEKSGCDNNDVISHCRQPALHVRGCWAVDLILGKE